MAILSFINCAAQKNLNIYGNDFSVLTDNQNVCIWTDTLSQEQIWEVDYIGANLSIRSFYDRNFVLCPGEYNSSNDTWNCVVKETCEDDCYNKITIERNAHDCYIRLTNNPNYYLTAVGTNDGANVCWARETGNSDQIWWLQFYPSSPSTSPTNYCLNLPLNLNQKYKHNEYAIKEYGCAVCCAGDVSAFYGNNNCTLDTLKASGVYGSVPEYITPDSPNDLYYKNYASCWWNNSPNAYFRHYRVGDFLEKLKFELFYDRPVIICCATECNKNDTHFVVAYRYINNASSYSDIYVYDPAGNKENTSGEIRTLEESMNYNGKDIISYLIFTSVK